MKKARNPFGLQASSFGGEGGIRTHGRVAPTLDFESGMRNMHYAGTRMDTSPLSLRTVHQMQVPHAFGQKIPNKKRVLT